MSEHTLGSDSNSLGKEAHFLGMGIVLSVFMFFTANATEHVANLAKFYLLFALVPMIFVLYDMVARRGQKSELIDTITVEDESPLYGDPGRTAKALIMAGAFALAGFIFMNMGSQSPLQLVAAPTFQLVEPGPAGSAFASGTAGLVETLFFWSFLCPTIYLLIRRTGLPKILAALAAIVFIAMIFVAYHYGVYGESPQKLDAVFYFAVISGVVTVATGNIMIAHLLHFSNNFGIIFFQQVATDVTMWVVAYWLLIATVTFVYLRRN